MRAQKQRRRCEDPSRSEVIDLHRKNRNFLRRKSARKFGKFIENLEVFGDHDWPWLRKPLSE